MLVKIKTVIMVIVIFKIKLKLGEIIVNSEFGSK